MCALTRPSTRTSRLRALRPQRGRRLVRLIVAALLVACMGVAPPIIASSGGGSYSASTGKSSGACPSYVIDHVTPLKRGGADAAYNMPWQTTEAAKIKDRTE